MTGKPQSKHRSTRHWSLITRHSSLVTLRPPVFVPRPDKKIAATVMDCYSCGYLSCTRHFSPIRDPTAFSTCGLPFTIHDSSFSTHHSQFSTLNSPFSSHPLFLYHAGTRNRRNYNGLLQLRISALYQAFFSNPRSNCVVLKKVDDLSA